MEALLLSHTIWKFFFIKTSLFSVCCEGEAVLVGGQLLCLLPSQCVQQFWLGCAFPVPPFPGSAHELAAGDTGQQVTREQEMMPWKPLPVALVAAAEGAEVNIINPNPKLFDSLLLIFAVLFIFP